jgi:hypothetical protein
MALRNDPTKYRKRTDLGVKSAAKTSPAPDAVAARKAMSRAFKLSGAKAYINLRAIHKKPK